MADKNPDAVAGGGEEPKAPETNNYLLTEGAEIIVLEKRNMVTKKGDGKTTCALTNEQAIAFRDKLVTDGKEGADIAKLSKITFVVGEETGGRPTIVEGAADAATAEGLGKDEPRGDQVKDESTVEPAGGAGTTGSQQAAGPAGKAADAGKSGQGKVDGGNG